MIRITDHAILRWLERVHGLNIEGMREQLLADLSPVATIGATLGPRFVVKRADGKYVFQGQTLVTVIRHDQVVYRRDEQATASLSQTLEVAP